MVDTQAGPCPAGTPERCSFSPVHSDEPTDQTETLVDDLNDAMCYPDAEVLNALARCMAETRSRNVVAMACVRCGHSIRV